MGTYLEPSAAFETSLAHRQNLLMDSPIHSPARHERRVPRRWNSSTWEADERQLTMARLIVVWTRTVHGRQTSCLFLNYRMVESLTNKRRSETSTFLSPVASGPRLLLTCEVCGYHVPNGCTLVLLRPRPTEKAQMLHVTALGAYQRLLSKPFPVLHANFRPLHTYHGMVHDSMRHSSAPTV